MNATDDENDGQATERVVIRDRRKIDPSAEAEPAPADGGAAAGDIRAASGRARSGSTGTREVDGTADAERQGQDAGGTADAEPAKAAAVGTNAELEALRSDLEERTHDLQRITAEYANYRKRVDRDRGAAAEQTTATVLTALLPVLDDIDRAREHGDLVGPFAAVAESFTVATGKLGLSPFGEKGDPFDPNRHEAVAHQTSPDVTEPTCVEVMRRGYTLGERLLRPALVAVADPE